MFSKLDADVYFMDMGYVVTLWSLECFGGHDAVSQQLDVQILCLNDIRVHNMDVRARFQNFKRTARTKNVFNHW